MICLFFFRGSASKERRQLVEQSPARMKRPGPVLFRVGTQTPEDNVFPASPQTPLPTPDTLRHGNRICLTLRLSRSQRQRCDPPQHASKKRANQTTLRQQRPVVPGMLYQTTVGFHQTTIRLLHQLEHQRDRRTHTTRIYGSGAGGSQFGSAPRVDGARRGFPTPAHCVREVSLGLLQLSVVTASPQP